MPAANTTRRYGFVTKVFHWLIFLLIMAMIPLGIVANDLPYDTSEELARKAFLFSMHKTLGVTTFFVALARIAWAISQPKPGPLHPDRKAEHWAAETVHWLLYGSLVLVPLSGWIHHAATSGFAPIWWPLGQDLPFIPKSEDLAAATAGLHIVFERVLVLALVLHVAGALKHHFFDRDVTLKRMWFARLHPPDVKPHRRHSLPFISALTAWSVAIGVGGILGLYASHAAQPPSSTELAEVTSEWQVTDGEISITITQMGSEVTGRFADWTASISFDETVESGNAGQVEVTISVASLTLGAVTEQAMGLDFFNAAQFPTATYTADILRENDRYVAEGDLTIKDQTMFVTLPFELEVTDGVAQMTGGTTLDRRNYRIGDKQTDPSSLAFDVEVNVDLTAAKPAQ